VKRRDFITLVVGATACPRTARAQTPKRMHRVGVVMGYSERDPNGQFQVAAFRQQLQKFGWIEGNNLIIDFRYAADDPDRIRALARELLGLGLDVMVSNSNLVTTILQSEVRTIPLVFISVSDPIGSGFVTDLARPSGNVTGFANFQPTMGGKWLDILRQIAPDVDHAGLLPHPEPPNFGYLKSAEEAAPSFNIKLVSLPVQGQRWAFNARRKNKGLDEGSVSRPSFHPIGHSGDVQPEEVRRQYEDAVTKPLDTRIV
jgi:ABC transporter substrate binding protein